MGERQPFNSYNSPSAGKSREPMHNMFRAIRRVMNEHPDVKALYPIHMNPVVRKAAEEELGEC